MPQNLNALESLIRPHSKAEFFTRHWGADYLITHGESDRFDALFSWDALSHIVSNQRFDFPRLRLLVGGRVAPPAQYIRTRYDRRGNRYLTHDASVVSRMLDEGAMLHLTSVGETWKPLDDFRSTLETDLHARVQVNLHAGFARSQGFHTHWDGHDVYAIQVNGRKRWRLFGFTEESPLPVPPDEKHDPPQRSVWEGVLNQGDMLYIPRGYWHATQFLDDPSLHLTFAVQHLSGLDFLQWVAERLKAEAPARRDIPIPLFSIQDSSAQDPQEYLNSLLTPLFKLLTTESLNTFLNGFHNELGRTNRIKLSPEGKTNEH